VPVLTASEISQHAFCARSWWLGRVEGYPSAHVREMASGRSAHRAHGRTVVRLHRLQRLGYALLLLAVLVAVLGSYLLARGL
jgi:hypothetical protein